MDIVEEVRKEIQVEWKDVTELREQKKTAKNFKTPQKGSKTTPPPFPDSTFYKR